MSMGVSGGVDEGSMEDESVAARTDDEDSSCGEMPNSDKSAVSSFEDSLKFATAVHCCNDCRQRLLALFNTDQNSDQPTCCIQLRKVGIDRCSFLHEFLNVKWS
jgi:hypothetical protein